MRQNTENFKNMMSFLAAQARLALVVGITSTTLSTMAADKAMDKLHVDIDGMTCEGCVKMIRSAVCSKLTDTLETCDVKVGSVDLKAKAGKSIDQKKVEELINATGSYNVAKKAEAAKAPAASH